MRLARGQVFRRDIVIRRGAEFFEDVDVVDLPSTTRCYEPLDLNAYSVAWQIRTGSDVDGSLVASFYVVPQDLEHGQHGVGFTRSQTDAFEANLSVGTWYAYYNDEVLGYGNVAVKDPDDA